MDGVPRMGGRGRELAELRGGAEVEDGADFVGCGEDGEV